ncbi:hypothetical protein K7X08_021566 [Anisodus acutangulus]|uniref:non-specific serine/threonine protein kinase n=1 Tax=Anisodus acutangulus TaxID=402998 RepID=A0A9Q1M7K4_9SOLA|nr:hypothetical protein K7X08_021566 [Anisodus acutangulus]
MYNILTSQFCDKSEKKKEEKQKSMAAMLWLLLLSAFHAVALAQQRHFNITLGSSLTPTTNSSWFSPTGRFAFGFYEQTNGYAVGISIAGMPKKTAVWTANRNSPVVPSSAVLLLTSDGRLIVQVGGKEIYVISPSQDIASASMLDTGNFVLYNSDHIIIWQSFGNPTNTILPGQHLSARQELFSSASDADDSFGIFRLKMQDDGNLVQYPVQTTDTSPYAYYATSTDGAGNNVTLNLDDDGHLYMLNSTISLKNLTEGGHPRERTIYLMKIDVDGIFRVYSHSLNQQNSSVIWSSTGDRCAPKGLCGLNGFCINLDDQVKCACLPGFDFVMPGNWSAGCERNFTAQTCRLKEKTSKYYAMRTVDNTKWEDISYSVLDTTTKEDCEQACLQDCNCEAALFKDTECRKQRLPLRFGRRVMTDSNLALVKVGINVVAEEGLSYQIEETKGKKLRIDILIASITLAAFALLVLGISGFLIHRNQVWTYTKIQDSRSVQLCEDVAPRAFSYAQLEQATSGFKEELGRGAFGTVFKGILGEDQKVVAVKRLDRELVEGETERKCVDWSLDENESILEHWVYSCFEAGELGKLVRDEEVDRRQFERMVKLSIWCIQDEPSLRPSMKKVLLMLEGTVEIPVPPSPTSFLSAI